jgi:prepilin-type processing-associated H-X9-DG protein
VAPAASAVPAAVSAQPVKKASDSEGEGRGREAQTTRNRLFADGSVEELRKAIILKEVLGPPLSLRDEGR